jgi:hypothetical protein
MPQPYCSAGRTLSRIQDECAAEAVYFTEIHRQRTVLLVVDRDQPSQIPRFAEPWFLSFNAAVEFKVATTLEDPRAAGPGGPGSQLDNGNTLKKQKADQRPPLFAKRECARRGWTGTYQSYR